MGLRFPRRLVAALFSLATLHAAEFTAYIGDANEYHVARLLVDASGNTYVAGNRTFSTRNDVFVMKLDAAGKTLFQTTIGGKGSDTVKDMGRDAAGNIYLGGTTSSPNFPLRNAFQSTPGDGFLVKLSADAGQVLYSTYFPGGINALAIDAAGNAYVTGSTWTRTFPTTAGLPAGPVQLNGVPIITGAFLTKISPAGDRILYSALFSGSEKRCGAGSSCFTGSRDASGVAVAVDAAGNAFMAGNTNTWNLPVTPGAMLASGTGAFVARIDAAGTALSYLTYLGSGNYVLTPNSTPANTARAIAVDSAGNAYVAGETFDPRFPATTGAYQTVYQGPAELSSTSPPDAFVIKLNPTGTAAIWATYVGGTASDQARAIALDSAGKVWITGATSSGEFPNTQGWAAGGQGFVASLNPAGSALAYSGRFPADVASQAIAVDAAGLLRLAGPTGLVSSIPSATSPAARAFGAANAAYGPIEGRISPGEVIAIYGQQIGPATPASLDAMAAYAPTTLGGVRVLVNDTAAPLLYVSATQINAVVPFGAAQGAARIRIESAGVTLPEFNAYVVSEFPQVFRTIGSYAALNQDGTLNSADHPAPAGSVLAIWATGVAVGSVPDIDGRIATAAENRGCCMVYMGESVLPVVYSGAAPGIVAGVVQINFRVPSGIGVNMVTVKTNGRESTPFAVYLGQ